MLIAYVDESGDTGSVSTKSSASYTIGCVLVNAADWSKSFDDLVAFRQRLKKKYEIPVRSEIKSNYLIRSSGSLSKLGLQPNDRKIIFRAHLNQMAATNTYGAFGVVVRKTGHASKKEVFEEAWVTLLQRLERTSHHSGDQPVLLIHDNGENEAIRRLTRWSRRRLTAGSMSGGNSLFVPFQNLIDDPVSRSSDQSYFLQLADLVAYAAYRNLYKPGPAVANVVDSKMWNNLGSAIFTQANQNNVLTTPGIVERTK